MAHLADNLLHFALPVPGSEKFRLSAAIVENSTDPEFLDAKIYRTDNDAVDVLARFELNIQLPNDSKLPTDDGRFGGALKKSMHRSKSDQFPFLFLFCKIVLMCSIVDNRHKFFECIV